ncbi:MAG: hypothetical protein JHC40_08390 [Burkholderiales bacterium]|jgi:hypothetical protein|nr:hypothetical protein [Burkholderiales bacterium]
MAPKTEYRVRHLPGMHDSRLIGVGSFAGVVKSSISGQKVMIEELEQDIAGQRG